MYTYLGSKLPLGSGGFQMDASASRVGDYFWVLGGKNPCTFTHHSWAEAESDCNENIHEVKIYLQTTPELLPNYSRTTPELPPSYPKTTPKLPPNYPQTNPKLSLRSR